MNLSSYQITNNQIIDIYKPSITTINTMEQIMSFHINTEDKVLLEKAAAQERLTTASYIRNKVMRGIGNE